MNAERKPLAASLSGTAAIAVLALGLSAAPAQAQWLGQLLGLSPPSTPASDKTGDKTSDGKTAAQKDAATKALLQPPADISADIADAQVHRKNGDLDGSAKILSQLVLFAPDNPKVLGEYGKTLAAEGRSDDALAFLERAIQLQPNDWSYYSAQGVAYDQKGDYKDAVASYNRSLALKPNDPTVLNNAALSRMQAGDLAGAETLLQQASSGTADFPRIAQNLALVESLKAAKTGAAPQTPVQTAALTPALAIPPQAVAAASPPLAPQTPAQTAAAHKMAQPFFSEARNASQSIINAPLPPRTQNFAATVPSQTDAAPPQVTSAALPPPKTLSQLQADPTVRMAPIPKPAVAAPAPVLAKAPAPQAQRVALAPAPKPAAAPTQGHPNQAASTYYLQAGAYVSESRAQQAASTLDSLGARVQPTTVDGRAIFRVRIGPFLDISQANAAVNQAQSMGHTDLKIVTE